MRRCRARYVSMQNMKNYSYQSNWNCANCTWCGRSGPKCPARKSADNRSNIKRDLFDEANCKMNCRRRQIRFIHEMPCSTTGRCTENRARNTKYRMKPCKKAYAFLALSLWMAIDSLLTQSGLSIEFIYFNLFAQAVFMAVFCCRFGPDVFRLCPICVHPCCSSVTCIYLHREIL